MSVVCAPMRGGSARSRGGALEVRVPTLACKWMGVCVHMLPWRTAQGACTHTVLEKHAWDMCTHGCGGVCRVDASLAIEEHMGYLHPH